VKLDSEEHSTPQIPYKSTRTQTLGHMTGSTANIYFP